ncbi:SDR family NAD(P)-dependent oxidoreductase [Streptomyces sp. JHD 1]|nr:SDR family NAD(P)-dependent oxidoreductase [Streptomyces sp. JHD 1]
MDTELWDAVERGDLTGPLADLGLGADAPLREVLPALAAWRRGRRHRAVADGWRYRVVWRPLRVPAGPPALTGRWLLAVPAADAAQEAAAWCERGLKEAGAEVVRLDVPDADALAGLAAPTGEAPAGVVSLLALDDTGGARGVAPGLSATLALVRHLGAAGSQAPLWCLTRGAVSTGAHDPLGSPAQAQVWGLGRVVGLEHPGRWGGLVDLPSDLDAAAWDRTAAVLAGAGGEDQVAVRAGGGHVRRLVPAEPGPERPWRARGTVLVTGGTGGLGARVARWAAAAGADRVVVTSRRGPDAPGAAGLLAGIEEHGATATAVACDVTDRAALAALRDRLAAEGTPVTAVVHTAGIGQATALDAMTDAELGDVLDAKVAGAAHLDAVFADADLDAFVLFSSIAATWGSGWQGGYAAANAHLDALAEHRRARGLAATSLAWGPWSGGGLAQGEAVDQLRRRGLDLMDPDVAITALDQSLVADAACVTVADVAWERFAPSFTALRPSRLLGELTGEDGPAAPGAEAGQGGEDDPDPGAALRERLAALPADEQRRVLADLVRGEAAQVLGFASAAAVEADRAFRDLGFDSVMGVELRNRLNAATGLALESTVVFDEPSPEALAERVRDELLPRVAPGDAEDADAAAGNGVDADSGAGADAGDGADAGPGDRGEEIRGMDVEALVRMAMNTSNR